MLCLASAEMKPGDRAIWLYGITVATIELWHNERARAISVPLITKSSYSLRGDKIAEWTWIASPESTRRFHATEKLDPKTDRANDTD